ncbi:MAG: PEP-CTERM sorting domain-containing protein [Gammaproteobacteria bacterium]|nr:PEP-CTERM sorting domain-containing protein [Gammaproteobacteria bacterium]MCF6364022.1 PEP-CTERM sorting domain-containing protein [Gammaproteobacteria bacterium]
MKTFIQILLFSALIFSGASSYANLISNGDFEAGTLAPGTHNPDSGTSQFIGCTGAMTGVTTPGDFGTGGSGNYTAYLDGSAGHVWRGGSASCANFRTFGELDITKSYNIRAEGTILNFIIADYIKEFTANSVADALAGISLNITLTSEFLTGMCTYANICSGRHEFAFAIVGTSSETGWLDNITLSEIISVPESNSLALWGLGLIALYASRRRQKYQSD